MKAERACEAPASPGVQSKPPDQSGRVGCRPQRSMSSEARPDGVATARGPVVCGGGSAVASRAFRKGVKTLYGWPEPFSTPPGRHIRVPFQPLQSTPSA